MRPSFIPHTSLSRKICESVALHSQSFLNSATYPATNSVALLVHEINLNLWTIPLGFELKLFFNTVTNSAKVFFPWSGWTCWRFLIKLLVCTSITLGKMDFISSSVMTMAVKKKCLLDRLIFKCCADDLRVRLIKNFRKRMLILSLACKFRIQGYRALGRVQT